MMFSSSMSVVEYYLLKRFPVPYGKSIFYFFIISKKKKLIVEFINLFHSFVLPCGCNNSCFCGATCREKDNYYIGTSVFNYIHPRVHYIR